MKKEGKMAIKDKNRWREWNEKGVKGRRRFRKELSDGILKDEEEGSSGNCEEKTLMRGTKEKSIRQTKKAKIRFCLVL